jgi:hypothetical protein
VILLIVGVVGLMISLFFLSSWGGSAAGKRRFSATVASSTGRRQSKEVEK